MTNASPGKVKALSAKNTKFVGNAIVTQRVTIHQLLLIHISQHELTDALDVLDSLGIAEDLALFIIANLQNLEVAS
ncbi:hypothetical protein BV378_26520 [Nostoc sp. RF31YmG]|nr:hypothetical protein BV378_26520 [Nostoc sp. RF31YmG]